MTPAETIYQIRGVFITDSPEAWRDVSEKAYDFHPDKDRRIVYAAPAHPAGDAIRDAALEEAAKACEREERMILQFDPDNRQAITAQHYCAAAIRALRGRAG